MAVPNVSYTVEVAFNAGYRTPAASRVWTDVSAYAELHEGMGITYGRTDEISVADANQFTVTLDNKDGRFTWGNAASPYYPNVKIGRPIRLTATIGGGSYVRFTGYVNEWPVEWPGGAENYATATLTNSSRLSRLGMDSPVVAVPDLTIEPLDPDYYWPLTEAVGATSGGEFSRGLPLTAVAGNGPVKFGAGGAQVEEEDMQFGVDDRTGVRLEGGDSVEQRGTLAVDLPTISFGPGTPGGVTIGLFVKNLGVATFSTTPTLVDLFNPLVEYGNGSHVEMSLDSFFASYSWPVGGGALLGDAIATTYDFETDTVSPHHLAVSVDCDGVNMTLSGYLDGALLGTDVRAAEAFAMSRLHVTGCQCDVIVGRVTVWREAVSAAVIEEVAASGLTGFAGDTTAERIERAATWARVPTAEVDASGDVVMTGATALNAQIVDLMRQAETTEAGVLYDDRTGDLVLKPRSVRYNAAVALTVDFDEHKVGVDYSPKVDRQGVANVGRGTNTLGTVDVTFTDEDSREEYGDAAYDVETAALDPDEPLQLAAWQVNANAEPRPRAPSVTFDVLTWIGDVALPSLLNLDIGSRIRLTNSPIQAPSTTVDYFVEGYTETFGVGSWSIALNLSPVAPYDAVFVLDNATLGKLDTGVLAL